MEQRGERGAAAAEGPAFRRDGAYALSVYLHAQTMVRCGWRRGEAPPADAEALAKAREALSGARETLAGLARYEAHPHRRDVPEPPVAWRRGAVRVLDYGGEGPPVLVVPSMVNRAYVLDLEPATSPLRWLAGQGFAVRLLDWGEPGAEERRFDLGAYLAERLLPAYDAVAGSGAAHLIGYCMGGPLALALAARRPQGRIVTLSAPWDFGGFPEHAALSARLVEVERLVAALEALMGVVPAQVVQSVFALRDPAAGVAKMRRFARMEEGENARRFVEVEDWLHDGVPMAPGVARDCLGWVAGDALRRRAWAPGGTPFRAADVAREALVVSASRDTVVRRSSAEPLADDLPDARSLRAPVGHLGMVSGARAVEAVWRPLASFLVGRLRRGDACADGPAS